MLQNLYKRQKKFFKGLKFSLIVLFFKNTHNCKIYKYNIIGVVFNFGLTTNY